MRFTRESNEPSRFSSLFNLAPDGGCPATDITARAVVSYAAISPLRLHAVCFCGPIQKLTPLQVLPGILLCGVRTFLTPAGARTPG